MGAQSVEPRRASLTWLGAFLLSAARAPTAARPSRCRGVSVCPHAPSLDTAPLSAGMNGCEPIRRIIHRGAAPISRTMARTGEAKLAAHESGIISAARAAARDPRNRALRSPTFAPSGTSLTGARRMISATSSRSARDATQRTVGRDGTSRSSSDWPKRLAAIIHRLQLQAADAGCRLRVRALLGLDLAHHHQVGERHGVDVVQVVLVGDRHSTGVESIGDTEFGADSSGCELPLEPDALTGGRTFISTTPLAAHSRVAASPP